MPFLGGKKFENKALLIIFPLLFKDLSDIIILNKGFYGT